MQAIQKPPSVKIDSKIVTSKDQLSLLIKMFKQPKQPIKFELLFRASDYEFDVEQHKDKYCGVAHTLLLVKTQQGKIIGGFTPLKWKKLNYFGGQLQYDISGQSFIFSLSNNHKLTLEKPTKKPAIYHNDDQGPTFCTSLIVSHKSNKKHRSQSLYYQFMSYVHPEIKGRDLDSCFKFVGTVDGGFYTQEWEVHRVIFNCQNLDKS